jgi:hypothetical protein
MGAKRIIVNGREVLVPVALLTGRELKELAAIEADRHLVRQRPHESQLVSDDQPVKLEDGDYFTDLPTYRRGGE